ncbi:hypothetical protein ACH4A8_38680 [Streptomyces vietnamensis]|uniref:hypothetical protein n=1 Tax=Streptomyces vietnamensis TaxID=362257 RepID=UPI003796F874
MAERLTFVLDGRDNLSRVLGHAGDSAARLRRQMEDASDGSGRAMLTLTQDAQGRLHDLEGRFVSVADAAALMADRTEGASRPIANWSRAADEARRMGQELKWSWLALTPAVLPMAAALAPVASATAAAGVGMAALALAAGRQVAAMSEASKAEEKYTDAVEENGRTSEEAVKAQVAYAKTMAKLPPATREAAAALSTFKDEYKAWSDLLAGDTMGPLVKGLGVVQGIFPKLTPTVKTAAAQLDRLVTVAGGAVASPGFDTFMAKVDRWASGALTRATDGLIHLLREAQGGQVSGGIAQFMEFARAQGPAVAATLKDLGRALMNLLQAGSDVGVGMLTVVQALSHLVAAVPSGAITNLLQLAIAIKAVRIAAAGIAAGRAAMAAFTAQIALMQTTAAGAPGRLAALSASFSAMSRATKTALVGSGIGLLVIALSELASRSEQAPPDVDKLTVSLKELGATSQVTGEAAKAFGSDLDGLYGKVRSLTDPSTLDSVQQFLVGWTGFDSTPVKEAKENLDAVDKSLASLVSNGQADLAAAAAKRLADEYSKGGKDASQFTSQLDDYQSALDDVRFEQDLAAQSMGLFGAQAQQTKQKLDAQKLSADGLRQSIQALNDVNRAGISAQIGFEQALDAAAETAGKSVGVWGTNANSINLNTEKGRAAATALNDLAAKTDEAAGAARESGASWTTVNGIYERGRNQLIENARQMGLNKEAAARLADQILKTPDKTAQLKGNMEDLQAKLNSAKAQLGKVPDARKAQVRANISQLEAQLAEARRKLDALDGKTSVTYVKTVFSSDRVVSPDGHNGPGGFPKYASGTDSAAAGWALVGEEGPELVRMRGGEQVFDHRTSMRMGRQLGAGQDVGAGLMAGMLGSRSGVEQAARGMAAGVESGVRAELEIASPSKKMVALMKDVRAGIVKGLTGSKAQIQAVARDLVADIWKAWEGKKTSKDSELVKFVNREHAKLQRLASKRDGLLSRLASARSLLKSRIEEQANYRAGVRQTAQDSASLSSLGLEPAQVTAGSIRAGLAQKLVKLRQFNRYISMLAKRGLNRNLLRQLLAMGPEAGFAYAAALAGMTNADFKQVNSLQKQIDRESDSLGRTGAKTLYDAGVNSAKGLVAGLQSQEKAIEQQMVKIAKGMERAIKKALGIKSPSRVGQAIGLNFGQSIGGGALSALPAVGRAVDAVAGRMAGMRPMPGLSAGLGMPAVAAGGPPVYITVQGAIDPVGTAKQIQRLLLKDKRVSGGMARGFE